jgi:ABC-2 type transport system permease protein
MLRRVSALIQKELLQLMRDRRTLVLLLVGAGAELMLFAAAVHTDIQHIGMVVADQSLSAASRSYLNAFVESDAFDIVAATSDEAGVMQAIDSGQASLGLVIPPDFAARIERRDASVLMLVDGSSAFTSQSAYRSAGTISQKFGATLTAQQTSPLTADVQILYNPDLQDVWFVTPAFIALIFQAVAMNLTSMSVARERESGTIEALLVTPIRPIELMLGKTIPNLAVVFVMAFEMLLVSTLVLGVPFRGNLLVFLAVCLITAGCGLSLGLVISTLVQTRISQCSSPRWSTSRRCSSVACSFRRTRCRGCSARWAISSRRRTSSRLRGACF